MSAISIDKPKLLNALPFQFVIIDMECNIVEASSQFYNLFPNPKQLSAEKIIFKDSTSQQAFKEWLEFIPLSPLDFEDYVGLAQDNLILKNEKGKAVHLHINYNEIKSATGETEFINIHFEDITDQLEEKKVVEEDIQKGKLIQKALKSK